MHITTTDYAVATLIGAVAVIIWRIREGRSAVTLKKILIPPAGMSTGFCMFAMPAFHIPWTWALISFAIGSTLLAWPLLATTKLYRQGEVIMMKRSAAFLIVIVILAAVRFFARGYFDTLLTVPQTGALFFILAFGMIFVWRASMFLSYRRLTAAPTPESARSAAPGFDAEEA
ncbi:MAG TPA: cytochrome c biogenesis protein CcdC [Terracidiphilus sp.]|nr:cytochrome c biogenesis protein CcdC [Terracidiphilus sp.]